MKSRETQTAKIIIIFTCIILAVVSVIAIVFSTEVVINKTTKTTHSSMGDTEKQMLEELTEYLKVHELELDKPVAFVKDNGMFRGRAYVFNVPVTEHSMALGLNGGTYSTEILLPEEYNLPTMYRCSVFAPGFGNLLFPSDYETEKMFGEDVYVITFNEKSLNDGSFNTLLGKMLG